MVEAYERGVVFASSVADGESSVEINAAVEEGLGYVDRIGMKGSNDVGARGKILGVERLQRRCSQDYQGPREL